MTTSTSLTATSLRVAFWLGLFSFLVWDWRNSAAIDLREEPPLFAAGSGQDSSGGHCSMATGDPGS